MNLPTPFKQLYALWMKFSHVLGMVMSKIILTLLWLVGFGIYGIVFKMINLLRREKQKESYWKDTEKDFDSSMKYQF
ncbi:hypothetical protein A3D11_03720 [Candidatus Peribacteria bacterium RIFCSPHIGHO2_02_FULL_49_16]|nr:MAG: hypothetical protein A2880_04680 [Candidatus Peribacteria bacterium RIFCSPHIGHO2_01_FULL_49_38]OGJ58842.1 MAG: hypothetical protein A3D11_03720 [Candidatus Peribacteria bacterium RIFCSPHIGHO2_02_FULL_49_16]